MDIPPGVPLDQLPGLEPPPGVTPNFINPDNYQNTIVATLAVCMTMATLFTALRLYSKIFIIKSIALEDYASVVAWVFYIAYVALSATTLQYGNGVHQWDVPLSSVFEFGKLASVVEILYCPIILSAKLAILLQIKHVFVTSRKSVRFYLIQIFIWSNAFWYITNIFLQALQCSPRAKIWKPLLPGHCFTSFFTLSFINTILNVVSDIAMLVMPILWVWKLQMTRKRKLGISLIFASGILACLSSVLRLAAFLRWGKDPDGTWYLSYNGLWTHGEITSAIMCACLPTLPRALVQIRSVISNTISGYWSSGTGDSGGSQLRKLRAVGIKRPSAPINDFEDYHELTNQEGGQNNPSGSKTKSVYSVV